MSGSACVSVAHALSALGLSLRPPPDSLPRGRAGVAEATWTTSWISRSLLARLRTPGHPVSSCSGVGVVRTSLSERAVKAGPYVVRSPEDPASRAGRRGHRCPARLRGCSRRGGLPSGSPACSAAAIEPGTAARCVRGVMTSPSCSSVEGSRGSPDNKRNEETWVRAGGGWKLEGSAALEAVA